MVPRNPVYTDLDGARSFHTTRAIFLDFIAIEWRFSLGRLSVEIHSVPVSSGTLMFGFPIITTDPIVGLGGKITPCLAHQFKICHIPPSTPFERRSSLP